jgi:hypothetical protein
MKSIIFIVGMLPLGTALDKSGAARLLAEGVVDSLEPFGPYDDVACIFKIYGMSIRLPDISLPAKPSHFSKFIERPTFLKST